MRKVCKCCDATFIAHLGWEENSGANVVQGEETVSFLIVGAVLTIVSCSCLQKCIP